MLESLPASAQEFMQWPWERIAPYYTELQDRLINASNVASWLADWTRLSELVNESFTRLQVATTRDTTDKGAEERYSHFLDALYPRAEAAENKLKEMLIASGLEPEGMAFPLLNMRTEASIFRTANLPLLAQERKYETDFDRIVGDQTVSWRGKEKTVTQIYLLLDNPDRGERERMWRLAAERQFADRPRIEDLWRRNLDLRLQLAANAGFDDYRSYRWKQLLRLDYTPADCLAFHRAIENVVVPLATRLYEKHRLRLGVETLRPWDLKGAQGNTVPLDSPDLPPLQPFRDVAELQDHAEQIFARVAPELGHDFALLRREGLLDLENRKGKAPGAYCASYAAMRKPFVFANAVGSPNDVMTTLHESGHAFHVFQTARLPYFQQQTVGMEFAEVASMGMELLASPYLAREYGGFYSEADAARAVTEHLEHAVFFWPYMAVVDAFQHWVYEHPGEAREGKNCDAAWFDLWRRFMPGVDWSGLDEYCATGWHRKLHIHTSPFYYVEYGIAQLGAVQVWRDALDDQAGAVAAYLDALSLGGTVSLPRLYHAAGARLAFDEEILGEAISLIEGTLNRLDPV